MDPLRLRHTDDRRERGHGCLAHVADCADRPVRERLRGLRADAPHASGGARIEKLLRACCRDHEQAVGFGRRGRHLRHVFRRGTADAARDPDLIADAPPDQRRDLARRSPQPLDALDVEERLVDRKRLHERGDAAEHLHHARRFLAIPLEHGRHDDRTRAPAQRHAEWHGRADPVATSLVRRTRDDGALVVVRDHDGAAGERRVIEGGHRDEERIHVDVQDVGARVVGARRREEPPRPVLSAHGSIVRDLRARRPRIATPSHVSLPPRGAPRRESRPRSRP